jgi:hypothetical protein
MKKPNLSRLAAYALSSLMVLSADVAVGSVVDQSQTSFNIALNIGNGIGQSFKAGISGLLTDIDVFSNGEILGGSNGLTLTLYDGSGFGGQVLDTETETVSSKKQGNYYFIDIVLQNPNVVITASNTYTFEISNVTGSGDLNQRGILVSTNNSYINGALFYQEYGSPPHLDLSFQTQVTSPVPLPAAIWVFMSGVMGLLAVSKKRHKL